MKLRKASDVVGSMNSQGPLTYPVGQGLNEPSDGNQAATQSSGDNSGSAAQKSSSSPLDHAEAIQQAKKAVDDAVYTIIQGHGWEAHAIAIDRLVALVGAQYQQEIARLQDQLGTEQGLSALLRHRAETAEALLRDQERK